MTKPVQHTDILIIGAGPVGMTLALALKDSPLKVTLLDRRPTGAHQGDPRALALSHGARQLLERLKAWPTRQATPIETIHISQKGGFGRSFMDKADYDLPALGYVVRYRDLSQSLLDTLGAEHILEQSEVLATQPDRDGITVTLRRGEDTLTYRTRLLVHAEGTPGKDPQVQVSDYHQWAVITEVKTQPGHGNRAWERFTPDGPLALLPLGDEFSIVFTLPPRKARQVLAMDDNAFLAALQAQFGKHLRFTATGPRSHFPLALRLREPLTQGRAVWIGNTAQTLHPVSGQGFNLGLRDAWQLAELLQQTPADPGDAALLATYVAKRKVDRQGSAFFTDTVVKLFSNDIAPLRVARGLGLMAMDLFPPARHFVAKRMIWGARAWP